MNYVEIFTQLIFAMINIFSEKSNVGIDEFYNAIQSEIQKRKMIIENDRTEEINIIKNADH